MLIYCFNKNRNLRNTGLSGSIPPEIGNLSQLKIL